MTTLSLTEVASLLKYNKKYFRDHYRVMGLPYFKLKGKILFKEEDVLNWLDARYIN